MSKGRLQGKVLVYNPRLDPYHKHFKKPTLVYVHEHVYTVKGLLSNFCHFSVVNKDGSLSKADYGCYDMGQFTNPKVEMVVETRVKPK